jgi:multidrug efflux pump subunit AcrB
MVTVAEGLQYAGLIVTGIVLYGMFAKKSMPVAQSPSVRTRVTRNSSVGY